MAPIWTAALSATAFLSMAQAFGGSTPFCSPATELERKVEFCHDNQLYVEAATQCLHKLSLKITAETTTLEKKLKARGEGISSNQKLRVAQNEGDLTDASSSLSALLENALDAKKEFSAYLGTLLLPGGPKRSTLARFRLLPLLSKARCYARNRAELETKSAELDQKIKSLRRTLAAAGTMRNTDQENLTNLKAKNAPGVAAALKPGKVKVVEKKAKNPAGASTITGDTKTTTLESAPKKR